MIDKAIAVVIAAVILFVAGFSVAWVWQEGKHDDYVRKQEQDLAARETEASAQRDRTAADWAANLAKLYTDLGEAKKRDAAYRRCVAAGRCGPSLDDWLQHCPKVQPVSPTGSSDEHGGGSAVPAPTGFAAGVIQDCSVTQLKLNTLRNDIRKQKGYSDGD